MADQFQPVSLPAPDWSAPVNWSEREIPAAGSAAVISGATAAIDPGVTLSAALSLEGGESGSAALIGNGGAFTLGAQGTISVGGAGSVTASLFASDSLVNQGVIAVGGAGSRLDIVVDLGAVTGEAGGAAASFSNQGVIKVGQGGLLDVAGTEFRNAGSIMLDGGTLEVAGGNLTDSGYVQIEHGGSARFSDGVEFQSFDFGSQGGTLGLDDPWLGPGVRVADFGAGDEIDLAGQAAGGVRIGDGAVTLLNGSGTIEGTLGLAPVAGFYATAVPAAAGSAIIAEADPPCFAAGSAILTQAGYRPVEMLRPGDRVVLASGGTAAIIWAGRRRLAIARHRSPEAVQPVRVMAEALAAGVPRAALRLSPDHALYLDGVLVPVKLLVNGATIRREEACTAVTYHHIELSRHGVVLAEGAPCETYLDTGNRAGFETVGPTRRLRWEGDACAPLCTKGATLTAIRRRLLERARLLGFVTRSVPEIALTLDGTVLRQRAAAETRFDLPARHRGRHHGRAVLRSASFRPMEFVPDSDDGRRLGIALLGISCGRGGRSLPLAGPGFHPRAAGDAAVWTDGAAVLGIPEDAEELVLRVGALPQGWMRRRMTSATSS